MKNHIEPSHFDEHTGSSTKQDQRKNSPLIGSGSLDVATNKNVVNSEGFRSSLNEKKTLKRQLGLFSGIAFILGMIVGSGIFVSPKGVLNETKSVGLCLVVWVLCGLVSLIGALCYAEIGTIIPLSGSELAYMKEGIGSVHTRTGDVLAFVFSWANTFVLQPSSLAILTLTFSTYFLSGVTNGCDPPNQLVKMLAIFAVGMIGTINGISVTAANRLNIIFVICKTVTILIIIITGLVRIGQGHTENLKSGFDGSTKRPLGIALAFYSGLWAYGGWSSLNSIAEELKDPRRNLWLSIVISLSGVIVLYLLTNISYFTTMNTNELLSSSAVAVTWAEIAMRPLVRILPILIAFSALGGAHGSAFSAARYCLVGARYGYLPEILSCIQKQRLTPLPSIILQTILGIIYCIPSDIENLIGFFSFSAWVFHGLTFVATICCKFTKRNAHRTIKVPIPLIIFIILVSIYLIIAPVISSPNFGYLIAISILLISLIFYYFFMFRKFRIPFINTINVPLKQFFDLTESGINIES